jgi:hypothetical protein
MSLILDALRKLEREKDAREPGVLVVGSVPWGERSRASRVLLVAGAAAVLALAVAAGWMLRPVRVAPAPVAPAAAPAAPATLVPRPAPTLPPPAPSLPALSVSATEPPPPPIRISRPPAQRPSLTASTSRASGEESDRAAVPAATPTAPAQPPMAPSDRAGAETATAAAIEQPTPATDSASAPTSVELSSAPAAAVTQPPPAPGAAAAPGGLRLNAISRRDGRPVALINDRLVFEGDSFDGVKVLRIGDAEVEVEVRGEKRVLRF